MELKVQLLPKINNLGSPLVVWEHQTTVVIGCYWKQLEYSAPISGCVLGELR